MRAYKLKNWKEYQQIVQNQIDMERLKYLDVVNYVLNELDIQDGAYRSSFAKYQMKREKDLQMRDARQIIQREIEQREMDELEFNEELQNIRRQDRALVGSSEGLELRE